MSVHPLHIVLSFTQLSQSPAALVKENPEPLESMDFNGTWQVYAQENYEEFLRAMGGEIFFFIFCDSQNSAVQKAFCISKLSSQQNSQKM